MRKITLLLAFILCCFASCKEEDEPTIINNEYYLVNSTDIIIKMSGNNVNKYLNPQQNVKIVYSDKFTGEFKSVDCKKINTGDMVLIYGHSNEDGKYLQVHDYELKVTDSVETTKDYIIEREYYFHITNDVLNDIINSMSKDGYLPQLLKEQDYEKYFL